MKKNNTTLENLLRQMDGGEEGTVGEQLYDLFEEAPRDFGAGFADRVMDKLQQPLGVEGDFHRFLNGMFRWVAIGGAAAAALLLAINLMDGAAFSLDGLSGLAEVDLSDQTTLSMF